MEGCKPRLRMPGSEDSTMRKFLLANLDFSPFIHWAHLDGSVQVQQWKKANEKKPINASIGDQFVERRCQKSRL